MPLLGQLAHSPRTFQSGASAKRRHRPRARSSWNKPATLYAGQWKERGSSSIMIKVWTGSVWSWIKVRLTGREIPDGVELGSPHLVRRGNQWWLHTPIEKQFKSPGKIERQVTTNEQTKICSVDLNLEEHLAVCTIRTVEGSILATKFTGIPAVNVPIAIASLLDGSSRCGVSHTMSCRNQ